MHVVCLAPVPVASIRWRRGDGPWTQTVVCKLTFQLSPGEATLAKRHDPIYERDEFANDDRHAPLFAPSDLVPDRPLVDVSLVGSAYAPGGAPVNALAVRLAVGTIDKRLIVGSADSAHDGTASFRSAELSYEHAENESSNPWPGRDEPGRGAHRVALPRDRAPGLDAVPGFGPLAAHWPLRTELLGGEGIPELRDYGPACELVEGMDLGYFNAAPPDQRLTTLDPGAELELENLHPEHPVLRCRFPNVAPQVFVERKSERRREEIESEVAALWIDARRGAATLTWQAKVRLEDPDERGRIWVAVAGPGRRLSNAQLTKLIGTLQAHQGGSSPSEPSEEPTTDDSGGDLLGRDTVSIRAARGTHPVPRIDDDHEDTKTSMFSKAHMLERPADQALADTGTGVAGNEDDGMPEWMKNRTGPPPPPRRRTSPPHAKQEGAPISVVPAAAPPSPRRRRIDPNTTFHGLGPRPEWPREEKALNDTASLPLGDDPKAKAPLEKTAPPPGHPAPAPEESPPRAEPAPLSSGAPALSSPLSSPGVNIPPPRPPQPSLKAMQPPSLRTPEPPAEPPAPKPRRARAPKEVVEMLWFDDEATALIRQRFRSLCDELDFAPPDERHDRPPSEGKRAQDHHIHFGILTQAPFDEGRTLKHTLRASVSETGRFTAPMVILRGELTMSFEDKDRLQATAAVVKPIAGDDKKLAAALEQVDELLATPLLAGSNETVRNVLDHLRKLYGQSKRTLTLEYLGDTVERALLEQRRYARRKLFGGEVLRGELAIDGSDKHKLVVYLPEAVERQLPLMSTFTARLVAEAQLRQDQYESHPYALKAITLGRVLSLDP